MRTFAASVIAAGLMVAVGVYHGFATDRWGDPNANDHPGRALVDMGLTLGDWQGEVLPRADDDDPKTTVQHRRYTHVKSGKWIMTAVSTGKPGYIAVHNPEHCYLGSGYSVVDAIRRQSFPADSGQDWQFWTGHFQKKKPTGVESIRIYWAWTTDGKWQAPTYPRLQFAGNHSLHKLYFIHSVTGTESASDLQLYQDFMLAYLNQLNQLIKP